jgi:hypothetical protein
MPGPNRRWKHEIESEYHAEKDGCRQAREFEKAVTDNSGRDEKQAKQHADAELGEEKEECGRNHNSERERCIDCPSWPGGVAAPKAQTGWWLRFD